MRSHYIPKAYFSGFTDANQWVYAYDMRNGKHYHGHRSSMGVEENLYSDETEVRLAKELEADSHKILDKIKGLRLPSVEEKRFFAGYIANMITRVPKNKKLIADLLPDVLKTTLWDSAIKLTSESGLNLAQLEPRLRQLRLELEAADQVKLMFEYMAQPDKLDGFKDVLCDMRWQFLTSKRPAFITSDNPVYFPRHLGIKDTELIFPLSTNLVIWANCKSTYKTQFMSLNKEAIDWINQKTVEEANHFIYFPYKVEWIDELIHARPNEIDQSNELA